MKKIIVNINMFDLKQFVFVYQNGNKIDAADAKMQAVPAVINDFWQKYNDSEIILQGAKFYVNKIKKELKDKYNIIF